MRNLTLGCLSLSILSLLITTGCSSSTSGDVAPAAASANPQQGGLLIQVDRTQAKALPDLQRGFLNAATITVRVLGSLDGQELISPTVVNTTANAALQEITLTGIPQGPVRVLISAVDQGGNSLGTAEQEAVVGPTVNKILFSNLFDPGSTRELGLLSTSANGVQSNGASLSPSISQDGRFVAFSSNATNLVTGETSAAPDIFVRDRTLGTLSRVSIDSNGGELSPVGTGFVRPSISPDGLKVVFSRGGVGDIFLREKITIPGIVGTLIPTSRTVQVNSGSVAGFTVGVGSSPKVSNSREVVFITTPPSGKSQVVLKNIASGVLELISVSTTGGLASSDCDNASISGDGRFVLFRSNSTNLVTTAGPGAGPASFFLRDRASGTTTRLPVRGDFAGMSVDARFIAVSSADVGGPGLFLLDRASGNVTTATTRPMSGKPGVSNDGQIVCQSFEALIPGDGNGVGDCYHWHPVAGFSRVNVAADSFAVEGTLNVATQLEGPEISGDGTRVAFASSDALLVPNDGNRASDVFSSLAPKPGKLYVTLGNAILRFDQAAVLTGAPPPAATISGASTRLNNPGRIALDATHDRLYVANEGNSEILVFENISTRSGNTAPDRRFSSAFLSEVGEMLIDVTRDRIFYIGTGGLQALMVENASTLSGALSGVERNVSGSSGLRPQTLLLDERRNELYVGGLRSGARFLSVFGSIGLPAGETPRREANIAVFFTGLAFDNSPRGVDDRLDPTSKVVGSNASLLAIVGFFTNEGRALRTFTNGSGPEISAQTVMQGGLVNRDQVGMTIDRYSGQVYLEDGGTGGVGDISVVASASLSGPFVVLRRIQFNGVPRGFALDRTH